MKTLNIFKKAQSKKIVLTETLNKNQLKQVIGGDGETDLKKMKDSVIQNIR